MTEEEKALFNAAIELALYCKNINDCSKCIFSILDTGICGVGSPDTFRVPAALCDKKE